MTKRNNTPPPPPPSGDNMEPTHSAKVEAFKGAFREMGSTAQSGAKAGEMMKRQTESMMELENGPRAVADTLSDLLAAFLQESPRPIKRTDFAKRDEDPVCKAWDDLLKSNFHNPLVQINLALRAATVPEEKRTVISMNATGEVTLKAYKKNGGARDAKALGKRLASLFADFAWDAGMELAAKNAMDLWAFAGTRNKAPDAPTS